MPVVPESGVRSDADVPAEPAELSVVELALDTAVADRIAPFCGPPEQAQARIEAAIAAGGGTLVSDDAAPSFTVLADAEGNKACITTWQGRD